MNFLKLNQKLKIVPNDIQKISSAVITDIDIGGFTVTLDQFEEFGEGDFEILIPTDSCLINFVTVPIEIDGSKIYFPIPKEYKTIQRREYTRIDLDIPAQCQEPNNEKNSFNSAINNLSGGGLRMVAPQKVDIKTLLEVKFNLHAQRSIDSEVEIVRVNEDNEKFWLSGMFKKISNIDRITIIQLCFKRHLELKFKSTST